MSAKDLDLFYRILRIRLIEAKLAEVYAREQMMRCPAHFSIGQEAVAVAACAHLQKNDRVVSSHRCHAHYLAKGGDLGRYVAELYGRSGGCAAGRGGSMHLIDREVGFEGASPIVGSAIPIACGIAFGTRLQEQNSTTVVFFGDGATETGAFHETLNFASVHSLSIVFVCENNGYSMETRMAPRQPRDRPITDLARAHRVKAWTINGQDIEEADSAFHQVIAEARAGAPQFVEAVTHRFVEHCGPRIDTGAAYRYDSEPTREGIDPVALHRDRLVQRGILSEELEAKMVERITNEIDAAFAYALSSPYPSRDDLLTFVFAEPL